MGCRPESVDWVEARLQARKACWWGKRQQLLWVLLRMRWDGAWSGAEGVVDGSQWIFWCRAGEEEGAGLVLWKGYGQAFLGRWRRNQKKWQDVMVCLSANLVRLLLPGH